MSPAPHQILISYTGFQVSHSTASLASFVTSVALVGGKISTPSHPTPSHPHANSCRVPEPTPPGHNPHAHARRVLIANLFPTGLVTSGIEAVVSSLRRGSQVEAVTLPEFGVMGGPSWLTERL